jgi:hypothetical protein
MGRSIPRPYYPKSRGYGSPSGISGFRLLPHPCPGTREGKWSGLWAPPLVTRNAPGTRVTGHPRIASTMVHAKADGTETGIAV